MLQDIMAGRKTEIDSLCGAVVMRGEDEGFQLLAMLYYMD